MDFRNTIVYYDSLLNEARRIVQKLRDAGIKAYITGGLALDYYTGRIHEHKDIDIIVDGFSNDLIGRVDSIMKSLGYEAIHWGARKDGTTGVLVFEKEFPLYNVIVDVFFKAFNGIMPFYGELRGDPNDDYFVHKAVLLIHYGVGSAFSFSGNSKDSLRLKELIRLFYDE